ncbi:hypothetical protein SDC9_129845 [bioreactor metagenome]|uniref:Uncharacterized protein n=1 Tax=bioreactor metagenome TaxID=1076179 RepID=A0A645D121_9ZZZZ
MVRFSAYTQECRIHYAYEKLHALAVIGSYLKVYIHILTCIGLKIIVPVFYLQAVASSVIGFVRSEYQRVPVYLKICQRCHLAFVFG